MEIFVNAMAILVGIFIGGLIVGIVGALPLMLLWNWLMPLIFGLIKITFWQAFGLIFLCDILFKSSGSVQSK